jgi:hypothetical protein
MHKTLLPAALLTLAGATHAHPGHGAVQAWHWHATDTAGLLTVAVLAAIALWLARGE